MCLWSSGLTRRGRRADGGGRHCRHCYNVRDVGGRHETVLELYWQLALGICERVQCWYTQLILNSSGPAGPEFSYRSTEFGQQYQRHDRKEIRALYEALGFRFFERPFFSRV